MSLDLRLLQSLKSLGLLPTENLADEVGIKGLESGMNSMAFCMLAGLMPGDELRAQKLFDQILVEAGLPALNKAEAARIYAVSVCRKIVDGSITPLDGATRLWRAARIAYDDEPDFHDLDPFIYYASEIPDQPENADRFTSAIVDAAKEWLGPKAS